MNNSKIKIINKRNCNHPRVHVVRSNRSISAQVIDDKSGKIIASISTLSVKEKLTPLKKAHIAGEELAKKIKSKYPNIVYDRANYLYHGQVKAFAEGLRSGGIKF